MGFEGFETSFSPSFEPLTDCSFTHSQGHCDVLLLPALLFELPGLHSSFFSPIGFPWCSHTSYLIILYFLLPRSVEQKIYQGVLDLGRKLFQCRINQSGEKAAGKRVGECGHEQHLADYRIKQILTMMGKVEFKRAYYQCQQEKEPKGEKEDEKQHCCGRAPADQVWGIDQRRTTPGVQEAIGYLCARLPFEEAAETFSRFLPLKMTARQAQNLMEPVGKALAEQEEKVLKALFEQAAQKQTSEQEQQELLALKSIERLYIEMDGIMERLRRGSIEMEEKEKKRKGDVYRELKVGVIFEAERGRERSELAPEVWVDTPKENSMRYVARRTAKGDFDQLLYGLAC